MFLKAKKTYLLAGGLGRLGRTVADWMVLEMCSLTTTHQSAPLLRTLYAALDIDGDAALAAARKLPLGTLRNGAISLNAFVTKFRHQELDINNYDGQNRRALRPCHDVSMNRGGTKSIFHQVTSSYEATRNEKALAIVALPDVS